MLVARCGMRTEVKGRTAESISDLAQGRLISALDGKGKERHDECHVSLKDPFIFLGLTPALTGDPFQV